MGKPNFPKAPNSPILTTSLVPKALCAAALPDIFSPLLPTSSKKNILFFPSLARLVNMDSSVISDPCFAMVDANT